MVTGRHADACLRDGGVHGPLQDQCMDMVPPDAACVRVVRHLGRRKDIVPPHPIMSFGERSPATFGVCLRDTDGSAERKVRLQYLSV